MDPITAFSLACGVIQVVDFSTKVVVKCREITKDGASSENKEIESMAKHLTDLFTDLSSASAVVNHGPMPQLYHDDQDLRKLAQQCSETAKELIAEIQKLSIQGQPRKRDVLRKAVKVVWKKSTIDDIQRRLQTYQRTLDTRTLINLRQHVHLISIEQSDGFRDLDRKLQNFIIGVSGDQNTFDELKDLIQAENTSSKQHVSQEFEKHRELIAADGSYKRLLESLFFPDIHSRQEGIEQAHKQTFEWIFDKPGTEVRPWHHFIDWLEKGHGTYWISGKAGAGKSTLMNFICQDPRTEAALRVWSGINDIFIPNFFFWNPGTQLQKSLPGLLRSLIYQVVDRFPDLMPVIISSLGPTQHRLQQLPTWTEHRLHATIQHLLSNGLETYRLCIFIDGLDEFSGDHTILLDLIRKLKQSTRVKFCLSSRPYQSFRDEFGSSAMLKLQDLTEPDIRRYVSDKLDRVPLRASQVAYSSFALRDTLDAIVGKAEGVFLWVNLAVRDQLEGIRNGDDAEQLRERLDLLPEEIEELYGLMLQRIDKFYWREVAQYFQLVLHTGSWSLFQIALAVHKRIDDVLLFSPAISISDIRNHCRSTGTRIATTCKGFLEVKEEFDLQEWQRMVKNPSSKAEKQLARNFSKLLQDQNAPPEQRDYLTETYFCHKRTRVEFLHRTAIEFFKDNEQGKRFLEINAPKIPHPIVLYIKALLADLMVFPVPTDDRQVADSIVRIVDSACIAEDETGVAQLDLMDLIDRSIAMLCQRSPGQPSNQHWCRAWGIPKLLENSLYFSSRHESKIHRTSESKNDDFLSFYSVDFLGFAAWWGLYRYALHIFDSQSGWRNPGTKDYLLGCAVDGLDYEDRIYHPHMKLISALLERGANPNMKIWNRTVWDYFLQRVHLWRSEYGLDYWDPSHISEVWLGTVRQFLESGADVNERIYSVLENSMLKSVPHLVSSTPLTLERYMVRQHLSALSILQQCFASSPEFSAVEDTCNASGASLYFECTSISFKVSGGKNHRWVDSKLSKQQLTHFSHTLDQLLRVSAGDYKEQHRMIERQYLKLFQELDMEQLYKQARHEDNGDGEDVERFSDESSTTSSTSTTPEAEGLSRSAHSSQVRD